MQTIEEQAADAPAGVIVLVDEEAARALEEMRQRAEEERAMRLDALGQSLAKTRAEAISWRQVSGIEDDMREDEEFYQGIDDMNRDEHRSAWRSKATGAVAQRTTENTRSKVFPNITRPFVDAASSRFADMILPTDDRTWSIDHSPIAGGQYDPQAQAQAKERVERARRRIEDWHVECQWHAVIRTVIEDAARIGVGVLKGPVPMKKTRSVWSAEQNALRQVVTIQPGSKAVDPWNFYPDPACGENIHNGSFVWERDFLTKKQLRELIGKPGYIDSQIHACLEEGATRANATFSPVEDMRAPPGESNRFEIWYFYGTAERDDLEAAGYDVEGIVDPHAPVLVEMVNNRVIKAIRNPLDDGEFPYDVMVWQRRISHWAGIGVARQNRTPQRIVTAGTRNLMDNAGLAAGPMIVFRQGVVYPADDGPVGIAPRRIWFISEDADEITDARMAIGQIKVDMLVAELMQIITLGMRLAEDVTGLPMLIQGQMGRAPDTVGGMQLLNNNASSVMRRLARLFDDRVTEPHVRRYYQWLLMDPSVPDEEKGDYTIDARGSSALVERDIQNQSIMQMGNMILDPRFGKDPKKWMNEVLKASRLDPKKFDYEDDQWRQIVANLAQGPQDPKLAIAQMRTEADAERLAAQQQFRERENDKDRALEIILAEMEREGKHADAVATIRGRLADTTIRTRTQRDLSLLSGAAREVLNAPAEPVGRADPGRAFER